MTTPRPAQLSAIPMATGGLARLACTRLRASGKDAGPILAEVGATPEQVFDDTVRLEVAKQIRILNLVARELQDDLLGFHLARDFDLREIGLVYYVIASSERLADGLRNAERYGAIMNDGVRLRLNMTDRAAEIRIDYVDVDRLSDCHQIEFWLATLMRVGRQISETRMVPQHVRVRHNRQTPVAEFRQFFGTDVEFGAEVDEVVLTANMAALPLVKRDNYLNDMLRRYADEALAARGQNSGQLRSAVEDKLPNLLPHGQASAAKVAQQLGMSSRTLSRRLSAEGAAFADILDRFRFALAQRYLAERELPISEISWLLGYSEVSSFTHAFKRWTGQTPRQFRSGQAARPEPAPARRA